MEVGLYWKVKTKEKFEILGQLKFAGFWHVEHSEQIKVDESLTSKSKFSFYEPMCDIMCAISIGL